MTSRSLIAHTRCHVSSASQTERKAFCFFFFLLYFRLGKIFRASFQDVVLIYDPKNNPLSYTAQPIFKNNEPSLYALRRRVSDTAPSQCSCRDAIPFYSPHRVDPCSRPGSHALPSLPFRKPLFSTCLSSRGHPRRMPRHSCFASCSDNHGTRRNTDRDGWCDDERALSSGDEGALSGCDDEGRLSSCDDKDDCEEEAQ